MGFLEGLFEQRATKGGSFHVREEPPGWIESGYGWDTATGVNVTPANALETGAVYACVRVLSESLSSLPLLLYRRQADGGKRRAANHYLYPLLHNAPNSEMTSMEFREVLMGHLLTWGNAYAEIEIDRAGRVQALWPLRPDCMRVVRTAEGELVYIYRLPKPDPITGEWEKRLSAWQVFHLRGLGSNGIIGYSPVQLQRLGIGLARATEEFGGRFFGNDARPGGVLEHPGKLSDEAHKRLRESWVARHQGLERSHRLAILEEGMKFEQIGLPPEDAQFLETRKFQRSEIAGWFRVPPHKIGDLERATFSNIEHQSIEFVTDSLRPWLVRWEQRIFVQLLTAREQGEYFAEFLVDALLRGDIQSRYTAYATARQNGWMSANDVRTLENMNPIPGGDVYLIPLNMVPAGTAGPAGGAGVRAGLKPAPTEHHALEERRLVNAAAERRRLRNAYRGLFEEAMGRVLRRERNDVRAAAQKRLGQRGASEFLLWLEEFFREHVDWVTEQIRPLYHSYGEVVAPLAQNEIHADESGLTADLAGFVEVYVKAFARRHSNVSRAHIRETVEAALAAGQDPLPDLEAQLDTWVEDRSLETADWESSRFNNALAKQVYIVGGRTAIIWVATGQSCAYCSALNGRVVGIQENFLDAGAEFQPEGAETPLRPAGNVGHPPAHRGCDCMTLAR